MNENEIPDPYDPTRVCRCENPACQFVMGFVDRRDRLHVIICGAVFAIVADGEVICPMCRRVKVWYVAEWGMKRLLAQRERAHGIG